MVYHKVYKYPYLCLQVQCTERLPLQLQVHDLGTWTFKGINGNHQVVQILPSQLSGRLQLSRPAGVPASKKATCIAPASGLLAEVLVKVCNLDTILVDPLLVSLGEDRLESLREQELGASPDGDGI
jgi:hypothetical protein